MCVCVSVTIWLWPDTAPMPWAHSLAAQLCIKKCSFRMTWWQYSGFSSRWPLWGAHRLTLGASQPPTLVSLGPLISTSPGSPRNWRHPPGARCAPHHCRQYVTFSAGRGDEEEGQKDEEKGEKEKSKKRKQVGKYGLVLLLIQKHNRHFLSTRAP